MLPDLGPSEVVLALEEELRRERRLPTSTYRLQLNRLFTFRNARRIVGYLSDLGVSDCYTSPFLKARPDSLHGYDITDHNAINPAIGTEEEYEEFLAELRSRGMGQIFDVVPNHMGIGGTANARWLDVLEGGQSSIYASFFDIDWRPLKPELTGKVLLPVLGDQYGRVLENQELELTYADGSFLVAYWEHRFPISPRSSAEILRLCQEQLAARSRGEPRARELSEIVAALSRLPSGRELDPEWAAHLNSEKAIVKNRLRLLVESWPELQAALVGTLALYRGEKGNRRSFDRLDSLLEAQAYRLSYWRVAAEEINYRRFFDVNDLAAIRVEDAAVFEETHDLILRLLAEQKLTGLRIDHPDGLWAPYDYLSRLQKAHALRLLRRRLEGEGSLPPAEWPRFETTLASLLEAGLASLPTHDRPKPLYLVAEKILGHGEALREEWPLWGTTGYDFASVVNGVFVDASSEKAFDEIYARFMGERLDFADVAYDGKKLIMRTALASELNVLGHHLNHLSEKDRCSRDFTLNSLTDALREIIACFPVYRTYIDGDHPIHQQDRASVEAAVAVAKRRNPAHDPTIFDFIRDVLLMGQLGRADGLTGEDWAQQRDFVMKFQQCTGPVMAKGVEDTAFYVYNRLLSLNEVGGDPSRFGISVDEFHARNAERLRRWPYSLLATSTHDSKRSEDVRARLNVLSELPREWRTRLAQWSRLNARHKTVVDGESAPDRNDEYMTYQTLLGTWPIEEPDELALAAYRARVEEALLKAIREAKTHTSWIHPNTAYEEATIAFLQAILNRSRHNAFLRDFVAFERRVAEYGIVNSLSQLLLKLTSPGVPDIYQGNELWELAMVDPDNRRAVDYSRRVAALAELRQRIDGGDLSGLASELSASRADGRIKLYVTHRVLQHRRDWPELYGEGDYLPLAADGGSREHLCAFARRSSHHAILVVAPRLVARLTKGSGDLSRFGDTWRDTWLELPGDLAERCYRDLFTGQLVQVEEYEGGRGLPVSTLFAALPVALLEADNG